MSHEWTEGIKAGAQRSCVHDYTQHPYQVSDAAYGLITFVILAQDAVILQYIGIWISSSPFWTLKKVL